MNTVRGKTVVFHITFILTLLETGKHALGDRARKLDQGILITRFELPFNIWWYGLPGTVNIRPAHLKYNSGTCNNHIGMGVRYNAEKKKIGAYFSTPIFSFRCKCHLCDGWFEIQTDPKVSRALYVSESEAFGNMVEYTIRCDLRSKTEGRRLGPRN